MMESLQPLPLSSSFFLGEEEMEKNERSEVKREWETKRRKREGERGGRFRVGNWVWVVRRISFNLFGSRTRVFSKLFPVIPLLLSSYI